MDNALTIEDHIESNYTDLSAKLRIAADFITRNPVDFATRSLRSIAGQTDLAPATFTRLSRALGFRSYEDMREVARSGLSQVATPYSDRASRLQSESAKDDIREPFLQRQSEACIRNIAKMQQTVDSELLQRTVERLLEADRVTLVAALGSAPFADYCSYLANWFVEDWSVAGAHGQALGSSVSKANKNAAYIVICKQPYSLQSLRLAELAAEKGAFIVVISDSDDCPALNYSDAGFILPSESPQFFPSYAATLAFIEALIGMMVTRAMPGLR